MLSGGAGQKKYSISADAVITVCTDGRQTTGVVVAVHNGTMAKAVTLPVSGGVRDTTEAELHRPKPRLGKGFFITGPQKAAMAQLHSRGWRVMNGDNPSLPEGNDPTEGIKSGFVKQEENKRGFRARKQPVVAATPG